LVQLSLRNRSDTIAFVIEFKKTILVKQALPCLFELPETGREAPVLPAQKL
jgi:hypothetical protein